MNDSMIPSASLGEPKLGFSFRGVSPSEEPPVTEARTDESRYRAMVDAYFDVVWRSLRGLGVPPAAVDDAAQQVFLVALNRLDTIMLGSERSFLLGTAVGIAANARRSAVRSREVADPELLLSHIDPAPNPEQAASQNERRAILEQVLDAMPDELRTVFVLFELEGLTSIEIGAMLGIPVGTATSRLRRAREQFKLLVARISKSHPAPRRTS